MELYGGILAASHELSSSRGTDQLLARLDENERTLFDICNVLTQAVAAEQSLTPAGEWIFDNFYLIEEQIRTAKRHLPKSYSRELPLLARGPSTGLPRVYDIALQAISHGDGRVDTESLRRFAMAYQAVANLQLGELWAIPIMLRLALIENLRRVGGACRGGAQGSESGRCLGCQNYSDCSGRSEKPCSGHCRYGAIRSANDHAFHFRIGKTIAGAGTGTGPAVNMDRAASGRIESND